MLLGIHECSYIESFSDDKVELFPFLAQCGIDIVEFSVLSNYSKERALFLKEKLSEAGLRASCCSALPQGVSFTAGDEEKATAGLEYIKRCIDFCRDIGSDKMNGILFSPWGEFNSEIPKREKWQKVVPYLREAADYAAEYGITINLEVLNRYESDFINTLDEGSEFLKMVDRPNLKLLADTFHMNIEEFDMLTAIKNNAPYIGGFHISENDRSFPREGRTDWPEVLKTLYASGYDSSVTFECCLKHGTEVGGAFSLWRTLDGGDALENSISSGANYIKGIICSMTEKDALN